jgi:hypothetical protein
VVVVDHELLASFTDTELQRLLTETQVFGWDVTVQENVDTFTDGCGERDDTVNGGLSVKNADKVRKIVEDGQIVLDADNVVVRAEQATDLASSSKTLLDIQERRRLVEHVDVGLLYADKGNGETLELSTRQQVDLTVEDVPEFELVDHLVKVVHLRACTDELSNSLLWALDGLGDLVDILGLDDGLKVVFKNLGKVVCISSVRIHAA